MSLKAAVRQANRRWIADHPQATLKDLADYLAAALDQCDDLMADGDAVIEDAEQPPEPLASYLQECREENGFRFSYRLDHLSEDLENVRSLMEEVGGDFPVADLP